LLELSQFFKKLLWSVCACTESHKVADYDATNDCDLLYREALGWRHHRPSLAIGNGPCADYVMFLLHRISFLFAPAAATGLFSSDRAGDVAAVIYFFAYF
jgi:hypothetical protein